MKHLRRSELVAFVLLSLAMCLGERHELVAQGSHTPAFRDRASVTAEQVVQNLVRMNAERADALQAYKGTRVYRLDYRGFPGGRRAEMVEPKTKNKFLYRGTIWIDGKDFAVVRIKAEPAKNPSFWTKHSQIERHPPVGLTSFYHA